MELATSEELALWYVWKCSVTDDVAIHGGHQCFRMRQFYVIVAWR
jgi:hypothetical protein